MNTNLLNEELKKFNLLSSYDTKLTLSENYEITLLNEIRKTIFQTLFKDTAGLLKTADDLKFLFKNDKAAAETFLKNAAAGKAAKSEMQVFMKDVLNNGNQVKQLQNGGKLYNGAIESYTKQLFNSSDNLATQFKNASEADRAALLKNAGYTDNSIKDITKKYKDLEGAAGGAGKNTANTGKNTANTGKNTANTGKNTANTGKNTANTGKNTANTLAKDSSFLQKFAKVKNLPWKKIRNWALVTLGITGAAIWYFMKDSGDPLPEDFPTTPPVDEGGGGGSNTGGATGGTKYTYCPETFPISQNCKNNKIKEIQACLSMPAKYQTGNFGNITQGYLERAGVSGTEITQDSYDKVCNKTTTSSTPFEDDEDEDTDLNQTSTTTSTTSTTSTDDVEEA